MDNSNIGIQYCLAVKVYDARVVFTFSIAKSLQTVVGAPNPDMAYRDAWFFEITDSKTRCFGEAEPVDMCISDLV